MLLIIRCQEGGFRQRLRFHCEQEQVELFGKKIRLLCLNRTSPPACPQAGSAVPEQHAI